jgi:tape measure domain-containing protein
LVRISDAGTELSNKLAIAAGEIGGINNGFDRLVKIANDARAPLGALGTLFQRGAIAAKELGATQGDLFNFVDTVAKGLAIQGGAANTARGALIQLSQSLGSGIVRAEEFNSVLEGAFPIALAAARGLDAAGGSVAKLRTLVISGKVASDDFFRAILSQQAELTELFERSTPTIGQAFTVLRNNLTQSARDFNEATGAATAFAILVLAVSKNLDVLSDALIAVAIGSFAIAAGKAIFVLQAFVAQSVALQLALGATSTAAAASAVGFITLQRALLGIQAVIIANPFLALATVIGIIAAGLIVFRSTAKTTELAIESLNDDVVEIQRAFVAAKGEIESITEELDGLSKTAIITRQALLQDGVGSALQELAAEAGQTVAAMRELGGATQEQLEQFALLAAQAIKGEVSLKDLRAAADDVGAGAEVMRPFVLELIASIDAADKSAKALERNAAILRLLEGNASAADRALLGLAGAAGSVAQAAATASSAIAQLNTFIPSLAKAAETQEKLNEAQRIFEKGREAITSKIGNGLSLAQGTEQLKALGTAYRLARAEIDGSADALRDASGELATFSERAAVAGLSGLERSIATETQRYEELRSKLVEAGASQQMLNEAALAHQQIVDGIKSVEAAKPVRAARLPDPTAQDVVLSLTLEAKALKLASREREIYLDLLDAENFVKGGLSETEAERIEGMLRSNQLLRAQAQIFEEIRGPQEALRLQMEAINALFESGRITLEEYNEAMRGVAAASLAADESFSGGFKTSIQDAILSTREFGAAVGDVVVGGINKASDAIVEFARTGSINIKALFADIFAQLLKLAAQQLLLKLVGTLIGGGAGGGLGGLGGLGGIVGGLFGGGGGAFPANTGQLTGFQTGGSFSVGGSGGPDSQLVAFKASPNERVTVETPQQQANGGGGQTVVQSPPVNVAAVLSPSDIVGAFDNDEGETIVINMLERNASTVKSIVNG